MVTLEPNLPGVSNHAQERMILRLGRNLTRPEWLAAVLSILDRKAVLIRSGDQSELYAISAGDQIAQAWWVPDDAVIVTVLSQGMSPAGLTGERAKTGKLRPNEVRKAFWQNGRFLPGRTKWAPATHSYVD